MLARIGFALTIAFPLLSCASPDRLADGASRKAPINAPVTSVAEGPVVPLGASHAHVTLSYEVKGKAKGFSYSTGGTLTWRQNGNAYEADLKIGGFPLGGFQRTSTGLMTPEGLAPLKFVDRRRSKERSAVFDREAGVIRYSAQTPDAVVQPGVQDQLSVSLQLAGLLNVREQPVQGGLLSVPVSSPTGVEIWRFEIGAIEALHLPVGEVSACRLVRLSRKANDNTFEVWLAPSLGREPVRMRLTEPNGDFLDHLLKTLPDVASERVGTANAVADSSPEGLEQSEDVQGARRGER